MVPGHVVTTGHYLPKISMVCNTMSLYIAGHSITAGHILRNRTHKKKFGINSGNTLIFIFQLQFSTVILFSRMN